MSHHTNQQIQSFFISAKCLSANSFKYNRSLAAWVRLLRSRPGTSTRFSLGLGAVFLIAPVFAHLGSDMLPPAPPPLERAPGP
jgi:hypothetical protein